VLLPVLFGYLLNATADQFVAERLKRDALAIAAESPISWEARGLSFQGRFDISGAGRPRLSTGSNALPIPLDALEHGDRPRFFKYGVYDALTLPTSRPGRKEWILVAQDRTVPNHIVDDVVTTFLVRFVWIMPASLLASLAIGLLILRRVTGRFRQTARQADAIGLDHIDQRLEPDSVPLEATPLVLATNHALDRLEAGYRVQGEFIGNVAHELRTPLALISLRVEALPPSPERDLIRLGVERANRVIQQLMDLAIVDRHHARSETFDPVALAREVVSVMAPLALHRGHNINFAAPADSNVRFQGIVGLVQIALANLIDNAVRHTPEGCTVSVRVEPNGSVTVADDGPGFVLRGPDDTTGHHRKRAASTGLGLSIVERIMSVCGGSFEIHSAPPRGTRCVIKLPVTKDAPCEGSSV